MSTPLFLYKEKKIKKIIKKKIKGKKNRSKKTSQFFSTKKKKSPFCSCNQQRGFSFFSFAVKSPFLLCLSLSLSRNVWHQSIPAAQPQWKRGHRRHRRLRYPNHEWIRSSTSLNTKLPTNFRYLSSLHTHIHFFHS